MPHRFDPDVDHRRSIRLKDHDYARGAKVFVTICTHGREALFGRVVDGTMHLGEVGTIASECWDALPLHFAGLVIDEYVVMPNHLHGVLFIRESVSTLPQRPSLTVGSAGRPRGPAARSVGAIVGSFKSATARRINALRVTAGAPVWQRNYYEHVVRNDDELRRIREYIVANPANWVEDDLYTPVRIP